MISRGIVFPLNYNLNLGESFLLKVLSLLSPERNKAIIIGSPHFSGYLVRVLLIGFWKLYGSFPDIHLVSNNKYLLGISKEEGGERYLGFDVFLRISEIYRRRRNMEGRVKFTYIPSPSYPHMKELLNNERTEDERLLFIVIGDPNKLTESYSIASNLIYAMSSIGVIAPTVTEVVDEAGARMIVEMENLLKRSRGDSSWNIPPFFLGVDPYQEPVKPMLAVLDALNPDFPKERNLFNLKLCLRDIPGALYDAIGKLMNLKGVAGGKNNLRFVRFYTCNCDLKGLRGNHDHRYVLEAFLEMGKVGDRGYEECEVIQRFNMIPRNPELERRLSRREGNKKEVMNCPFDITCPLITPLDAIVPKDETSLQQTEITPREGSKGGSTKDNLKRFYIFACMRDNYLPTLLDILRKLDSLDEKQIKNSLVYEERSDGGSDVKIHYLQEHLCPSENTLIEIYGEHLKGHQTKKREESILVRLYSDDRSGYNGLHVKDLRCPLRAFLRSEEDGPHVGEKGSDLMIYFREVPLSTLGLTNS
ncbi:MAG: hypothetical protein QI197_04650 [Candidatus Korarchaeota archaeon]|nr:hypothetical protein [Candidatus Korarchaeota archaeon]